jgi:hypothetical protein
MPRSLGRSCICLLIKELQNARKRSRSIPRGFTIALSDPIVILAQAALAFGRARNDGVN